MGEICFEVFSSGSWADLSETRRVEEEKGLGSKPHPRCVGPMEEDGIAALMRRPQEGGR